ncbi:MAG: AAA family ATPase [Candidatus Promineifilaceae bacterium]
MNTGDQIEVGTISGEGIAIGRDARVEINRYTEIIVRPDSFEDVPPAPGPQPYKGLAYFTEADADNFFGRETLSEAITHRLGKRGFLAVIGASGSGKSSLLRAGIVPLVRKQNWLIQIMTPMAQPLQRLANALTAENSPLSAADDLQAELSANPRTLHLAANRLAAQGNADHLLLVIDQFEELFTLCRDEEERQPFINNLLTAANEEGALTIMIGLRADFYGRVAQYEELRQLISQEQEYIGPMRQEDLVRVIAEPAKRGGWQLVEGLVEQILEDVAGEPGYLPLLSHALLETWELRRGTVMTLGGYRAAGGVEGAIARTAEDTLQGMDSAQIPVVRHIFLSLTEPGEGAEDTRRIATMEELRQFDARGTHVDMTVEELVRARLITLDDDEVQVAHEALIRRWPRLRSWIDENRERLSFNRRLTRAAQEWEENGRQPDYLFRGAQLAQAESRIEEYTSWGLVSEQEEFMAASREAAAQAAMEEEKLAEVGRQDARRSAIFAIAGGALGLGLAAIIVNLATDDLSGIIAVFFVAGAFITGLIVGFFYVPIFDAIVSSVRSKDERLTWLAAVLVGAVAFIFAALLFFFLLSEELLVAFLTGSVWGGFAGAGRLWSEGNGRSRIMTVPLVSVVCGLAVTLVYGALLQLGDLSQPFALWLVFVIGILVPLAILLAENGALYAGSRRN